MGNKLTWRVNVFTCCALGIAGCAFDDHCDTPDGRCVFADPASEEHANATNGTTNSGSSTNQGTTNSTDSLNSTNAANAANAANATNSATNNVNAVNAQNASNNQNNGTPLNNSDPGFCPRVTNCGPEPDEESRPLVRQEAFGCREFGVFQGAPVEFTDALCDGDRDWHGVAVQACDSRAFVLEATVTPDPGCQGLIDLYFTDEDGNDICGDDDVECDVVNGVLRARAIIAAGDPRQDLVRYFVVDSTGPGDAPYTIRVRAYQ